jgi:hypothetical protein
LSTRRELQPLGLRLHVLSRRTATAATARPEASHLPSHQPLASPSNNTLSCTEYSADVAAIARHLKHSSHSRHTLQHGKSFERHCQQTGTLWYQVLSSSRIPTNYRRPTEPQSSLPPSRNLTPQSRVSQYQATHLTPCGPSARWNRALLTAVSVLKSSLLWLMDLHSVP